jgi:hypothetical protein
MAEFLQHIPDVKLPDVGPRPGTGQIASSLPARAGDRLPSGERARPDGRPAAGLRPKDSRPAINRPGRPNDRPLRPADRELVQNLPSRIRDHNERQQWRQDHRGNVLMYLNDHRQYDDWYGDEWWLANHLQEVYDPTFNYWAPATWSATSEWITAYDWSEPVYYSYGDNVYYQDGSVYYGDRPVATEEEYAAQAEAIATSVPEAKPAAGDWMPLGVYAMTSDGKPTGAEPTMYLQLAVSKQGIISGTFQNTATNSVQSIEGMVDRETQRAAWTPIGKTRPLMESGVINLTQSTTPALVHFADGTTQQWLLVRVDKPKTGQTTSGGK